MTDSHYSQLFAMYKPADKWSGPADKGHTNFYKNIFVKISYLLLYISWIIGQVATLVVNSELVTVLNSPVDTGKRSTKHCSMDGYLL
jgi:hypothetical protein